jgi:poly(A)-specific ribonuclease
MDLLYTLKKPLIGHNCYSDLLFIYNSLIANLPNELTKFKHVLHSKLPEIYDTK